MAQRHNHYDAAFEAFLRNGRTPYVAVDEARRALLAQASLKSMDYIVYSQRGQNLLVDVKGRKFPSGGPSGGHAWENWATEDDLASLAEWERVFGAGFRSILVFAYEIVDPRWLSRFADRFSFRDREYAFFGVWSDEYAAARRPRSAKWSTVTLPLAEFRRLLQPIRDLL